jgi:hypothetical protein
VSNYAYIKIRIGPNGASKEKRIEVFSHVLNTCVPKVLDDRWKIKLAPFEDDGPVWMITLPGTAGNPDEAGQRLLAPGEDVGFPVALQSRAIAFRHSLNMFQVWAQGRVEEELADYYGHGIFFDATNRTQKAGTREYRKGKTFHDYLTRNLAKPLSAEDKAYIDSYKRLAPEGHW